MPITSRQTGSLAAENWTKVYQTFRDADFTSYDFESLRKTMIDYIKINYAEEFNDFTESSEFIALIDLIAFLGQSLAFRTDLNARENFIDTAERRDSILKLARLISYNSKRNLSASGYLKIDSVSTTETVYDSDGYDLSDRIILWNDNSNSNWFEQFVSVLNASLLQHQNFGSPSNSQSINKIRTEEYGVNLINNILPIFKFDSSVGGLTTPFEIVSASSSGKSYIYEVPPDINKPLNVLYRNDGNGNGSNNTGFFFYFKQGELTNYDFSIETQVPNKIVEIDVNDINNNDVWLYQLDNQGFVSTQWQQVPTTAGINVIYNNLNDRNLYQVNSRANDQISLVFGDGSFANTPLGNFRLFYRVSNGLNYKITPDEMQGIQISLDYISRNNRVETITFTASLRYTVANASSRETADEIKQRAPQQYYTQNRMITGEDYNIFPYTSFSDIRKVKAVNRTSSGLSRYLDVLDTTGKYSSTNIFGEDGVLYSELITETINFSYKNETEIRKFIRTTLVPDIIDNKNLMHYYYEKVSPELPTTAEVSEQNMIDGELYQIVSVGTSDFTLYGATANVAGTVFRSVNSGTKTRTYAVDGFGTAAFILDGKLTEYNPTITVKTGDILVFKSDLNQPIHIKNSVVGGFLSNVTVGSVTNNGSTSRVTWDTTGVPAGTYYYVSRNYGGPCYDISAFVAQYRGNYVGATYQAMAEKIIPLYRSNNQYTLPNGQIRYGLFKNPDHAGLAYWTTQCLNQGTDPETAEFYKIFFEAAILIDPVRPITPNKEFIIGTYGICGFADVPQGWSTNYMAGAIVVKSFGTGTVTTSLKWNQSSIGNGVTTGYFTYNGNPISIGMGVQGNNRFLNTGGMIKFTPDLGSRFNANFNIVPGVNLSPGDSLEKYSAISQIFGDGTNNGLGNFANGTGPVSINLPIPTGAVVEAIVPPFKNALRDFVVNEMVTRMANKEIFGLDYNVVVQNWVLRSSDEVASGNWLVRLDWNSVNNYYVISYKSLRYVFYSPAETNFFFDKSLQVFDSVNNKVINDSVKILRTNGMPGQTNSSMSTDSEWYISSEVRRPDGYIENKRVYLTYADSNQDGVPDVPNLFDHVVVGGPFRTSIVGLQAQKFAVTVNYQFKRLVGRYPSVSELDQYVQNLLNRLYQLVDLPSVISSLEESVLYRSGVITAKELVFLQLVKTDYGNEYNLLDNSKVVSYYGTKSEIEQSIRNFNVDQLFYARKDNQFYKVVLNKFGNKAVSDGLNLTSNLAVPNYIVSLGRQNLFYQYRHNSPNTNRIDPSIGNIIDLYVLTSEYEDSYRLWLSDTTNRFTEPSSPTDLELYDRYKDLENYKSISDTIVVQSAKYKPLFGAKAASELQATFKVVKNPSLSITDADIKTSVVAAINSYFSSENWDFGDTFYFSELAAYLHKVLVPNIASIVIVSKNVFRSFGNLYQVNSEPYELIISAATVDDVEVVTAITAIDLQPSLA